MTLDSQTPRQGESLDAADCLGVQQASGHEAREPDSKRKRPKREAAKVAGIEIGPVPAKDRYEVLERHEDACFAAWPRLSASTWPVMRALVRHWNPRTGK